MKALEEMVKLGQMDMTTFESLRDEIIGGEVKDVHLVKGLDWKLLERVRKGEDVLGTGKKITQPDSGPGSSKGDATALTVDEEFDLMEKNEIQPIAKEEKPKKGEMAPPPLPVTKKRNRDEILKELKASRLTAAEKEKLDKQPSLGPRFTKLGEKKETSRIERDIKGREVLITVDDEGRVKRKVKKARVEDSPASDRGLLMPDKGAKPLGMEVLPAVPSVPEENYDGDIFEGVGNDYNPLAGLEEDGSDGSDESDKSEDGSLNAHVSERLDEEVSYPKPCDPLLVGKNAPLSTQEPPIEQPTSAVAQNPPSDVFGAHRNYFNDSEAQAEALRPTITPHPLSDPAILAALKKASTLNLHSSGNGSLNEEEAAKVARRKKMLEIHDRDEDDMDLSFGGSRFEDGEDGEDRKTKLSVWKGESTGGGHDGGKEKRKRGPKKRKGDVNNAAADVLQAMERRKEGLR